VAPGMARQWTRPAEGKRIDAGLRRKVLLGSAAQTAKAHSEEWAFARLCRRSPNLPHTYACSTIGPTRLNFRVRDGNGWDPRGKLTGKLSNESRRDCSQLNRLDGFHLSWKPDNYEACVEYL
jgi:hypothetical protein